MTSTQSKKAFVEWLKGHDPFLYAVALKAAKMQATNNGLSGLFDGIDLNSIFKSAVDTVKSVAPKVLEYQQQKKLLDIQVQRAKNNQPPIDITQYTKTLPPQQAQQAVQPSVPDFNPQYVTTPQQTAVTTMAKQVVKPPMMSVVKDWAPIGIAALGLFFSLRRRGRRGR